MNMQDQIGLERNNDAIIKIGINKNGNAKKYVNRRYGPGSVLLSNYRFHPKMWNDKSLATLEKRVVKTLKTCYRKYPMQREHFLVKNTRFDEAMFLSIVDYVISKNM
jgi:hypothetical protein